MKKKNKDTIQPVSGTIVPRFAGPSTFASSIQQKNLFRVLSMLMSFYFPIYVKLNLVSLLVQKFGQL